MKNKIQAVLPFLAGLLLWKVVTDRGLWSSYILPPPCRVWETALHMVRSGELVKHIAISLRRILWGFSWAFVASCVAAAAVYWKYSATCRH